MKNLKLIALLIAAAMLTFTACKDDEPKGDTVEISGVELSPDNITLTVTFNQAVYKNDDKTGNLDAGNFIITFTGTNPVNATFVAQHTAGNAVAVITITYETRLDGDETLQLKVRANTVYNAEGGPLELDLMETLAVNELGIIGKWSAYDISAILASLGFDDSLYANFYQDNTYLVTAYASGYPIVLTGTYQAAKSNVAGIWNISLNQTSQGGQPTDITSQGIFRIFPAAQDSMWYEVAQVDPAIAGVTPPTAEGGFGSTSGGMLGTMNVQKYYWIGH